MKRLTCIVLLTLILTSMFIFAMNLQVTKAENQRNRLSFSNDVGSSGLVRRERNEVQENMDVVEHKVNSAELEELKQEVGVWREGANYNQLIDGHGTGLRPPTDEEWEAIADNMLIVDSVGLNSIQSAPSVDHSAEPWFPPIGNQDGEGSCVCWAVGYYMKTFQEAKEHGWDVAEATWEGGYSGHPTPAYQDRIISPDFIYHLINYGTDEGASFYAAIQLVSFIGASTWEKMPYDPIDHVTWPSEEAWKEAPLYRGNSSGYEYMFVNSDSGLNNLKNWIAAGNLAVIAVDAYQYASLTSADFWTLDNYVNPSVNHANTIVGYDDMVEYVENGESRQGAFKIANSWGVGDWEEVDDGYYWVSYETMKQRVGYCSFYRDIVGYEPELTATFRIDHEKRDECDIAVGMGSTSSPIRTKSFSDYVYQDAHNNPFCTNNIVFDITEFKGSVPSVDGQLFFMSVYDWGWPFGSSATGTILYFAIDDTASSDPPVITVNGDYVFASLTLMLEDVIYIKADGSIEPSIVPIVRVGDLYTFTGNIIDYNGIVIERDNIVLDGANHLFDGGERTFHNGITLEGRENVTIKNMIIKHFAWWCIHLNSSSNNFILENDIASSSRHGGDLMLESSSNNLISGNNITDSYQYYDGICLSSSSDNNSIVGNYIQGHDQSGVGIHSSSNNIIGGNNITNNGRYGGGGISILGFSSNNSIIGNSITDNGYGIYLDSSNNSIIVNSILGNGDYGVGLFSSSNNSVSGNNITQNVNYGVYLELNSLNNTISANRIADNGNGIGLYGSPCGPHSVNNSIIGNVIVGNGYGVYLRVADNNTISGNRIEANILDGIVLDSHDLQEDGYYPSQNNTITQNIIRGNRYGVFMLATWDNRIVGNNITGNMYGIGLDLLPSEPYGNYYCENNTLAENVIEANSQCGIQANSSTHNSIYHNNFIHNGDQVRSVNSSDIWDNGYPSGGNYWSDYTDVDLYSGPSQDLFGSDGIWDHPYELDENNQDHYPLVNPWVMRSESYLAVRGANNEIYYRICNSALRSWEGWAVLPEGATCDSPAVAANAGKLYFVVRGMDGQSLWFGSVNLADHGFSGWTLLSGASPSAPTLVSYGSKLVLVVRGFTNTVYYRSYDCDSETWTEWTPVPDGATCDNPAAAVLGTSLHLVVRGFSATDAWGNSTLWCGIVNLSDNSFSGWTPLDGWTPSAPVLAASGQLDKLYLTVRGGDNRIWINSCNGAAWEGWTALPDGSTCDSPAITAVNNELHVVVRCMTGTALWHYCINLSTEANSGWIRLDGWTPSAPTSTC